ncbi:hypothetical protein CASFOL_009809 [Castilleja foliolosa]|uniref:Uncharacterized protein n=1 Tax=Castilleja foliolosa TaxID=1961234 RepID=A0ABD3DUE2_9LAMI
MFSSSNNIHNNCYNPFDDDHHQNPNPPFLLPFPSPFFNVDHQISPINQNLLQTEQNNEENQPTVAKPGLSIRRQPRNLGPVPRRRAGKKDRHSKICTAQGIRDRRMRLSLQIARKFFDLQDALGYDKASKTIGWLFDKSKKAIKELTKAHPQYCDDVSNSCNDNEKKSESFVVSDCEVVSGILMDDDVNPRPNSKSESRERARARAKCRTMEKMMVKVLENGNNGIGRLGFSNCQMFDQGSSRDNDNNNQERVSLYGNLCNSLEQQFGDVGTIEKFLENSSSIMSCPNYSGYNYQRSVSEYVDPNNNFVGSFGNWDVLNSTIERTNSGAYSVASNQVSLGENPSSIYTATP